MKKLFVSLICFASSTMLFAENLTAKVTLSSRLPLEGNVDNSLNNSSIESILPLFAISLVVILIIQIAKFILDNKLKNKIIDRTISEQLASSILEKSAADKKDDSIKWAILLLGVSGGLTVTYHTLPLDIHSIAIIAFSAGISYLVYFLYLQKKN